MSAIHPVPRPPSAPPMRRVGERWLPPDVGEERAFHHLVDGGLEGRPCRGVACFAARPPGDPSPWLERPEDGRRPVYCLGACHAAPRTGPLGPAPSMQVFSRVPTLLERIAAGGGRDLAAARAAGAYEGLEIALRGSPGTVVDAVVRSELRGRGGAGFPTGLKWAAARRATGTDRFVVANLDEGDPGAFGDRILAEEDPHALIEGLLIAAYAVGASAGCFYVRAEYPEAAARLEAALAEAATAGWTGPSVGGTGFACRLEVRVGRGSYVCGEETALLNALEGRRPAVRPRPPYPVEAGYLGRPTVVNNAETLAVVPWILRHGASAHAALGIPGSRGTKLVCLNSVFRRPGLYEVDFGTPLRTLVDELGGGLRSDDLWAVHVGGPLAGLVPASLLDVRLGFDEMRAVGASVGHGGLVAFGAATSLPEVVEAVFAFADDESCGECTPCRAGARTLRNLLARRRRSGRVVPGDREVWDRITRLLCQASLCGLGGGLGEFAGSVDRHFAEEWTAWLG